MQKKKKNPQKVLSSKGIGTLFLKCVKNNNLFNVFFFPYVVVVQSLGNVQLFTTPWTAAHQASLSFTISQRLLKFMFTQSVMSSNHLLLCHPSPPPPALNLSQLQEKMRYTPKK